MDKEHIIAMKATLSLYFSLLKRGKTCVEIKLGVFLHVDISMTPARRLQEKINDFFIIAF